MNGRGGKVRRIQGLAEFFFKVHICIRIRSGSLIRAVYWMRGAGVTFSVSNVYALWILRLYEVIINAFFFLWILLSNNADSPILGFIII